MTFLFGLQHENPLKYFCEHCSHILPRTLPKGENPWEALAEPRDIILIQDFGEISNFYLHYADNDKLFPKDNFKYAYLLGEGGNNGSSSHILYQNWASASADPAI